MAPSLPRFSCQMMLMPSLVHGWECLVNKATPGNSFVPGLSTGHGGRPSESMLMHFSTITIIMIERTMHTAFRPPCIVHFTELCTYMYDVLYLCTGEHVPRCADGAEFSVSAIVDTSEPG